MNLNSRQHTREVCGCRSAGAVANRSPSLMLDRRLNRWSARLVASGVFTAICSLSLFPPSVHSKLMGYDSEMALETSNPCLVHQRIKRPVAQRVIISSPVDRLPNCLTTYQRNRFLRRAASAKICRRKLGSSLRAAVIFSVSRRATTFDECCIGGRGSYVGKGIIVTVCRYEQSGRRSGGYSTGERSRIP